jgi:hypothetical protein
MRRKQVDGVEAMLRKADATLDEWFRQSRITTQQASVVFGRFLERATRQGAGALRQPVDGLQASLERLSSSLQNLERPKRRAPAKPPARRAAKRPAATRKSRKAA